jgi:hypothetical protein
VRVTIESDVDDCVLGVVEAALRSPSVGAMPGPRYADPWRLAALHEGANHGAADDDYALSPRSTLGATRA